MKRFVFVKNTSLIELENMINSYMPEYSPEGQIVVGAGCYIQGMVLSEHLRELAAKSAIRSTIEAMNFAKKHKLS